MDPFSTGSLLLRLIAGLALAAHGCNKVVAGSRIPGTARWFDGIGLRPGRLHALFAAGTEIGAGLLLPAVPSPGRRR